MTGRDSACVRGSKGKALSVTFGDSSPRGRAKEIAETVRYMTKKYEQFTGKLSGLIAV